MLLRVSKVPSLAVCIVFLVLASSIDAERDEVAIKETQAEDRCR